MSGAANGRPRPIGVLALQGGFEAHARTLAALGHEVALVRSARALSACGGLILPGGESTVHLKLLDREGLCAPLAAFVASGRPVLATCAGLILAAARVLDPEQPSFGFLDVAVRRNAWGRQLASFEARDDGDEIPVVAIRAPRIVDVGPRVRVLATLRGEPILVREENVTGATFHPELTPDLTVHASVFGHAAEARALQKSDFLTQVDSSLLDEDLMSKVPRGPVSPLSEMSKVASTYRRRMERTSSVPFRKSC
jgi:5'-phosphate synthase pdxT subunit